MVAQGCRGVGGVRTEHVWCLCFVGIYDMSVRCGVVERRVWKSGLFVCLGNDGGGTTTDATGFRDFGDYFRGVLAELF